MDKLFAVCAPGLEPFLTQELEQLGLRAGRPVPLSGQGEESGGVEFQGDLRDMYRANLWLRTASRVLVWLGAFDAAGFPQLVRKASRLPWERHLAPGQPVALRVTCHKSRLYHSGAVAERVARAIGERMGQLSPVEKFSEDNDTNLPQLILVRLAHDHCTISVDSSGALLHRRGYRLATAKAPLRETLAAGMLMASGWDMTSPLLDPFCGSGTIPIEAALMARKIPPGRARRFAFMDWPNFDAATWPPAPLPSQTGEGLGVGAKILASDRDAGAIESAQANAERAGVADCIEFSCRAVSAIEPPTGAGWVVTNPPYGVRVSAGRDLRNLYAQFGNVMRDKCSGWHIAMLCDNVQLIHNTGLKFDEARSISLVNGGLKVRLSRGIIV
jgi:putative N6-adenine-specific DNA methylase